MGHHPPTFFQIYKLIYWVLFAAFLVVTIVETVAIFRKYREMYRKIPSPYRENLTRQALPPFKKILKQSLKNYWGLIVLSGVLLAALIVMSFYILK